ncbi:MAG: hypothetical protein R2939_08375 [Kofleriaceae bacterium]
MSHGRSGWPLTLVVLAGAGACGEPPGDEAIAAVFDPSALDDPTRRASTTCRSRPTCGSTPRTARCSPACPRRRRSSRPTPGPWRPASTAWGTQSAVFVRLTGGLDASSLPDPAGSLADDAAVYLVDVDPTSPARGERVPLRVHHRFAPSSTLPGDALAAAPMPGFALREATTYALVVTGRVRADDGDALLAAPAWAALRDDPASASATLAAAYAPLWAYLDEPGGDARADVVAATVFTTQHATAVIPRLREAVWAAPAPVAADVTATTTGELFTAFEGTYEAPNFQRGTLPYRTVGGDVVVDEDGLPVAQRTETLRFCVTVPPGPTPGTGWPIVVYEHGTGGDYRSFIDDGTAGALAAEGLAVISMDQLMHGPRNPGGDPELDFFNFFNPQTARDNVAQGAADGFGLTRLALGLTFVDGDDRTITVDPERVYFFGHSQGATTGVPMLAYEPRIAGAVLSGAGGGLYLTLLSKTEPLDIPGLVATLSRDEPLDEWTPTLHVLQAWAERADATNYGAQLARTPPPSPDEVGVAMPAKAIFQTEGITDHFAPNPSSRALSVAIGGDQVAPAVEVLEGLTLRGRTPQPPPLAGNLAGTTVAVAQYTSSEGHFVVFDVPAARTQSTQFLATLAATGVATVVAP